MATRALLIGKMKIPGSIETTEAKLTPAKGRWKRRVTRTSRAPAIRLASAAAGTGLTPATTCMAQWAACANMPMPAGQTSIRAGMA